MTEHEAMPILQGVKWAANKWIHLNDFQTPYNSGGFRYPMPPPLLSFLTPPLSLLPSAVFPPRTHTHTHTHTHKHTHTHTRTHTRTPWARWSGAMLSACTVSYSMVGCALVFYHDGCHGCYVVSRQRTRQHASKLTVHGACIYRRASVLACWRSNALPFLAPPCVAAMRCMRPPCASCRAVP